MEAVKSWCLSICVSVVLASIILMIAPNTETNKIIKVVISAFILIGVFSPLFELLNNSNNNIEECLDNSNYEIDSNSIVENQKLHEIIEESAVKSLYPIYKAQLETMGVNDEFSLSLDFELKSDGVEIKKVNITIYSNHKIDKEQIEEKLNSDTSFRIIVN